MASSFEFGNVRPQQTHHQRGYLIEALLLLTILVVAITVFMNLFSLAVRQGDRSVELDEATHLATNVAEQFSANPAGALAEYQEDGYRISCDVVPEATQAGTFYRATITVWSASDQPIYTIQTARYVSGVR